MQGAESISKMLVFSRILASAHVKKICSRFLCVFHCCLSQGIISALQEVTKSLGLEGVLKALTKTDIKVCQLRIMCQH